MRTGTVSRPLKLSTVSEVTTDDGSWFQCMIVRDKKSIYRRLCMSEYVCNSLG